MCFIHDTETHSKQRGTYKLKNSSLKTSRVFSVTSGQIFTYQYTKTLNYTCLSNVQKNEAKLDRIEGEKR